jgi:hypothetical protein
MAVAALMSNHFRKRERNKLLISATTVMQIMGTQLMLIGKAFNFNFF